MIYIRRIVGDSMLPGLYPGSLVVGVSSRRRRIGDVVMLRHNGTEKIKRLAKIRPDQVYVVGDNPGSSTDSRDFGWLPQEVIFARIVWPRVHKKPADG